MKLWLKILIALAIGACTGILIHGHWLPTWWADILIPIGKLFLSLLSMVIVPLVFSSVTIGITNIHDPQKLSRVGLQTLLLYFITTVVAIFVGLFFAQLLQPGQSINLQQTATAVATGASQAAAPTLSEIFMSIIPSNPIAAMAQGNILQVIVFALFLGVSINFAGSRGKPLLATVESLADVMFRMTSIIMEFSPIGVFAIMAGVTATFGGEVLLHLFKLLMVYYAACLFHAVVVFCGMLYFLVGVRPWPFFRGMGDAIMVAFSTCSSSATLPVLMHCVHKNLGVSKNMANFVLPLGTTINMNGAAIYQSMSALFIAQAYGIELSGENLAMIVATSTLSAIGAAGIPGSGFIMLSAVFASAGLPLEGLSLLLSIDRVREMMSTVLNVLGDAVCALVVARREGEFDERQYYHTEIHELEVVE
jgi:Na+/H+-dicarboxylate symporter